MACWSSVNNLLPVGQPQNIHAKLLCNLFDRSWVNAPGLAISQGRSNLTAVLTVEAVGVGAEISGEFIVIYSVTRPAQRFLFGVRNLSNAASMSARLKSKTLLMR